MENEKNYNVYENQADNLNDLLKNSSEKVTNKSLDALITELVEKVRKQEDFLYNISHDLRSHLNVILSIMQVINQNDFDKKSDKSLEYLKLIRKNGLKMLRLMNNLIDTNKIENNYYILKKCNANIVAIVESTVETVEKYSKEKNIQIIFDTNEEECLMSIDSEVVDRILMNLLSNAIKFSYPNTNIFVTMTINEKEVQISVKDEGPGISLENQKSIFRRFYRIQNKKVEESGSGIGLDLVSQLVKIHDGKISLVTEEGKGCDFIVTLPIRYEADVEDRCIRSNSKIEMLEIEFSDIY